MAVINIFISLEEILLFPVFRMEDYLVLLKRYNTATLLPVLRYVCCINPFTDFVTPLSDLSVRKLENKISKLNFPRKIC